MLSPFKDEVEVTVLTPLGQEAGKFVWPKVALPLLEFCNGSSHGYWFAWKRGSEIEEDSISSPRLTLPPELQKLITEHLWKK